MTQHNTVSVDDPVNRLQHFPVTFFAVVMGLSGLAISYQKAHEVLGLPHWIGMGLAYLVLILFAVISLIYGLKMVKYPAEVRGEFTHPIRLNFFAAISISMLLIAVIYHSIQASMAIYAWYAGAILHLFLTLYVLSFWINHNVEIHHSNPAWFIPIVGNVIIPVAGIHYVPTEIVFFFFSIGLFFWLVLFTLIFYRIIFHHQLVEKFMPTLFIFIAPPAIGFVAYVKMVGQLDLTGQLLYNVGLFFTLLLFFMYKNFTRLKFFISWWAFTFPMAAMTIATIVRYQLTQQPFFEFLSYILLILSTLIITTVAVRTIQHIIKGEICVVEK
ncbi:SLAC1 anion channel family protein [Thioflexithrix psekupsensis]|uniref:C4-dicarboxylate ABC transporter n=1 Tax=Thioflexithrix psekupsensis TaxID=1570016 RepID=A0A251X702_9GAMM|nr:SLAC1 anion channel family protein [Thioflexithrix psekupsensis]OUD13751.1 C4-dicarboxylate ABC transporter [Thioflexithrix psekupsensis]